MTIRKTVTPTNDFWMLIADLLLLPEEFNEFAFPPSTYDWLIHVDEQIDNLLNQTLAAFDDVRKYVQLCREQGKMKWIKTIDEKESIEPLAFYLCFGENPDGLEKNISFRIDQNWDDYLFPIDFDSNIEELLRKLVLPLSGLHIDSLEFPEFILGKELLGHSEKILSSGGIGNSPHSNEIVLGMKDYFLLAQDYWGMATLVDKHGMIWQWNLINRLDFQIRETNLDVRNWLISELKNPFRQRLKPDWI